MKASLSRRKFLCAAATTGAAICAPSAKAANASAGKAAGARVRAATDWPISDVTDEEALLNVLRSGKWGRTAAGANGRVAEFEKQFAERMAAKYCVATSSGTTALLSALGALNLGPGDEVILPPYTFVATFNVITMNFALPVFVDVDSATFQIDPKKIPAAIRPATKVLLPVHIGGSTCEIDAVVEAGRARNIPVIEDACQAPFAEWKGRPVGTRGIGGCFSFQASKNLTAGEGGAVLTNDEAFAHQVHNFHTPGNPKPGANLGRAANFRLTEFQAALLMAQMTRTTAQYQQREENAQYLTSMLEKIPGIAPAKLASGNNRSGWHLYMMRYDGQQFQGLPRAKFLRALAEKGVSASGGYGSLNLSAHVKGLATNPHYLRIYGKEAMARWVESCACPVNDKLVEEAVWFSQTRLLGSRADMERIAETIADVQKRAGQLAKA